MHMYNTCLSLSLYVYIYIYIYMYTYIYIYIYIGSTCCQAGRARKSYAAKWPGSHVPNSPGGPCR